MTEEQRQKARIVSRKTREKRLRDNPPKYAHIHPDVLAKSDDHPLSRKNVVSWIKTQKSLLRVRRQCEKKRKRCVSENVVAPRVHKTLRVLP